MTYTELADELARLSDEGNGWTEPRLQNEAEKKFRLLLVENVGVFIKLLRASPSERGEI